MSFEQQRQRFCCNSRHRILDNTVDIEEINCPSKSIPHALLTIKATKHRSALRCCPNSTPKTTETFGSHKTNVTKTSFLVQDTGDTQFFCARLGGQEGQRFRSYIIHTSTKALEDSTRSTNKGSSQSRDGYRWLWEHNISANEWWISILKNQSRRLCWPAVTCHTRDTRTYTLRKYFNAYQHGTPQVWR